MSCQDLQTKREAVPDDAACLQAVRVNDLSERRPFFQFLGRSFHRRHDFAPRQNQFLAKTLSWRGPIRRNDFPVDALHLGARVFSRNTCPIRTSGVTVDATFPHRLNTGSAAPLSEITRPEGCNAENSQEHKHAYQYSLDHLHPLSRVAAVAVHGSVFAGRPDNSIWTSQLPRLE
jgi:hypothetical protein